MHHIGCVSGIASEYRPALLSSCAWLLSWSGVVNHFEHFLTQSPAVAAMAAIISPGCDLGSRYASADQHFCTAR